MLTPLRVFWLTEADKMSRISHLGGKCLKAAPAIGFGWTQGSFSTVRLEPLSTISGAKWNWTFCVGSTQLYVGAWLNLVDHNRRSQVGLHFYCCTGFVGQWSAYNVWAAAVNNSFKPFGALVKLLDAYDAATLCLAIHHLIILSVDSVGKGGI